MTHKTTIHTNNKTTQQLKSTKQNAKISNIARQYAGFVFSRWLFVIIVKVVVVVTAGGIVIIVIAGVRT